MIVGLCIGNIDAPGDAGDFTPNDLAIAHQLDLGQIAFVDRVQLRFLEIGVHPKRIGVDDRDPAPAHGSVIANLRLKICDPSVYGGANLRALQIYVGLLTIRDSLLILRVSRDRLRIIGLLFLQSYRRIGQLAPPFRLLLCVDRVRLRLLGGSLGERDRNPIIGRVDDQE